MKTLILLVAGHYLADYGLQSAYVAEHKAPGVHGDWKHVMTAHCAMHAGIVLLATGHWDLALIEFAAHFFIDSMKCEKVVSYNQDQAMHLACKLLYLLAL